MSSGPNRSGKLDKMACRVKVQRPRDKMQFIPELLVEAKNDARLPGVNFARDLAPFRVSRGASPIGEIEVRDKLPRGIEMFGSHLGLTIVHIFTPLTVERMTNPGSYDYYSP